MIFATTYTYLVLIYISNETNDFISETSDIYMLYVLYVGIIIFNQDKVIVVLMECKYIFSQDQPNNSIFCY